MSVNLPEMIPVYSYVGFNSLFQLLSLVIWKKNSYSEYTIYEYNNPFWLSILLSRLSQEKTNALYYNNITMASRY